MEYEGASYTVTALAEAAFESCTTVTSLTLPPTIRSIGSHCFYNCTFSTLQLPDSLRRIDDHAFLYSSISSLHLPACFEEYDECTFWARNLMSITVDEANLRYRSIDGWLYSKDSLTLCIVPTGETGAVDVPSYVRHLGKMAFGFCGHITSITMPEGLVSIGDFAFNCCAAVNNIVIPSTVTHIGICPFSYCPQMNSLSIGEGNTHYVMDGLMLYSSDYDTLVSCHKSDATVTLNPNVKVLGGFENNTWVRNISIPESVTDIPDSLCIIPKDAFNSCIKLSSVTWGNDVEEIGDYAFGALSQMSSTHITTLDLPMNLKKIGEAAFGACSNSLRNVYFYGRLDTMGSYVFSGANLDNIFFATGMPPAVVGDGPLEQIGGIGRIHIPCGLLAEWTDHIYWGRYADKMEEDCGSIDNPDADDLKVYTHGGRIIVEGAEGKAVRIFDITGRCVRNEAIPTGIYLVKVGNRPAQKVVVIK